MLTDCSGEAIPLKGQKYLLELLLTALLRLGRMRDAHILKQVPKAEVGGAFIKCL